MADTPTVSATVFARNFARYQHEAIARKLIVVTSHDRVIGGYLSAGELEHYEQLKARESENLKVGELDFAAITDIEAAKYGQKP